MNSFSSSIRILVEYDFRYLTQVWKEEIRGGLCSEEDGSRMLKKEKKTNIPLWSAQLNTDGH